MPRRIDEARLFEAVLQLWLAEGYAGTTTRAVAARAGVNEATLFRRYGDKAGLVVAALSAQLERVPIRALRPTEDVQADLVAIVEAYLQTHLQVGALLPLLMVEVPRHAELRPVLEVAWTNVGALRRVVEHHQARGALRAEPPLQAVTALIGPLFAAGMFASAQPDLVAEVDIEAHIRGYLGGRWGGGPEE